MRKTIIGLFIAAFGIPLVASAETYFKWKDENGNWEYGANAPHGVAAIEVNTYSGANSGGADPESESVEAAGAASSSVDKELCARAKDNLDALNSGAVIQTTNELGESVTLGAAEIKEEKDKARAAINQYCLGFS